ncbi:MAG: transcriptional repressor [Patescibacteria group bacterium]
MPRQKAPATKKSDWRLTKQRLVILDYVRRDHSHPTAEAIFSGVKKVLPRISIGTVYRNLGFLREHGYLKEFAIDKVTRFEGRVDSHVHFVCEQCHGIEDLRGSTDARLMREMKKLARSNHFMVRSENYEIRGVCRKCQRTHSPQELTPELFCMACGDLLEDLKKDTPVCKACSFSANCDYYASAKSR